MARMARACMTAYVRHTGHARHRRRRRDRPRPDHAARRHAPSDRHHRPRAARAGLAQAGAPRVHRLDHRRQAARARPRGVRGRSRLPPRGAAVDAVGVHAGHRAPGERRGHAEPARVRAARRRVARPAGDVPLSLVDRRLRPARPRRPRPRAGRVREDEWNTPRTMYGCNKLYCEHLGRYYARFYKQLAAHATRPRGFPLRALSRADLGDDRAVGRHLRLRAGDDPRRRARRAVRLLRAARHAHSVHGDARRGRGAAAAGDGAARAADADGLQPRRVQSDARRRSTTSSSRAFPDGDDHLGDRLKRQAHRRFVAGGRRRLGGAARLGLRAGVRFPTRVRRVSDSDHPGAVPK